MIHRPGLLCVALASALLLGAAPARATTAPDTEAKVAPFQFDYHRGAPRRGDRRPSEDDHDGYTHRCPGDQVVLRPEARSESSRYVRTWARAMECVRPNGTITLIGSLQAPAGLAITKPVTLRGAGYALVQCGPARTCLSANLNFWDAVRIDGVNFRHDGGGACAFGTLTAGNVALFRVGVQSSCGGPVVQAATRGSLRQVQVDAGASSQATHAALSVRGGDFDLAQIALFGAAAGLRVGPVNALTAADVAASGARGPAVLVDGVRRQAVFDRLTAADSRVGVWARSARSLVLREALIASNAGDGVFVSANAVRDLGIEGGKLTDNGDSGLALAGYDGRLRLGAQNTEFSDNRRFGIRSDVSIRSRDLQGVRGNRLEGNSRCTERVAIDEDDNICRERRSR